MSARKGAARRRAYKRAKGAAVERLYRGHVSFWRRFHPPVGLTIETRNQLQALQTLDDFAGGWIDGTQKSGADKLVARAGAVSLAISEHLSHAA